jgi:hypothetical protein
MFLTIGRVTTTTVPGSKAVNILVATYPLTLHDHLFPAFLGDFPSGKIFTLHCRVLSQIRPPGVNGV